MQSGDVRVAKTKQIDYFFEGLDSRLVSDSATRFRFFDPELPDLPPEPEPPDLPPNLPLELTWEPEPDEELE